MEKNNELLISELQSKFNRLAAVHMENHKDILIHVNVFDMSDMANLEDNK